MSQLLAKVQFYDKYSRYRYDLNRREDWYDTVERVTDYLFSFDKNSILTEEERQEIFTGIYNKDVMPSMRNLAMAGKATERQNICSFNCGYVAVDDLYVFYEVVLVLISGCGLGYSVENRYVSKLPVVKKPSKDTREIIFRIPDTSEGWAEAIYFGISQWYKGNNVKFDFSQIRPAGSILRTKGGRASGPDVLKQSLFKIRDIIFGAQGRKLNSLEVHDVTTLIAKCIVSGGVRRSACLCLFDYDDELMRSCKNSENIKGNEQRYLSNNSAVIEDYLSFDEVSKFMTDMFNSYAGEPGIFSRYAINKSLPERRNQVEFGTNACSEITLRNMQFCNLSSVVCRPDDTLTTLKKKVKLATILGTLQAMSEHFPGLREQWKINQQEERLLGVDLNGIMDVPFIQDERVLEILYKTATDTNHDYSMRLGITPATAVTCIKPSGNASVMLDTSPGIHARWDKFYIRRIQLNESNPILTVLKENNIPVEPSNHLANTYVAAFPVKSPEGAITNGTYSALEQLDNWKLFKTKWAEHSVSCTVSYYEHERNDIINWVYNNQDIISGISFLPKDDAVYAQMPYEKITEEQYNELIKDFPTEINWERLHELEYEDNTNAAQTTACTSDKCLLKF